MSLSSVDVETKTTNLMTRNSSWKKTIREKWKSSSSLSSLSSNSTRSNSSVFPENIESPEDAALEMVNSLLRNNDSTKPIVYRQIKEIVSKKYDESLFLRVKPQIQEMLYLYTTKKGETLSPTPRYKALSAMSLCKFLS